MELNNSIFTLVVTVIAALLSLSYPLFMQIIQRIDEKYKSILLVTAFKEEQTYKIYHGLLIATFIATIYLLFAPACNCPIVKNLFIIQHSAHLISLLFLILLITYLIKLAELIWDYNDPLKLYTRIVGNSKIVVNDKKRFSKYLDLYKYAIKVENEQLLLSCNQTLADSFVEYRNNKKDIIVVYPDYFYLALRDIIDLNCKLRTNTSPIQNASFTMNMLLDEFQETLVSENTLRFIWNSINKILVANKDNWVIQYWVVANQYYSFVLDKRRLDSSKEHSNEYMRFMDMNYVLGGFIMYKKKYKLLQELMSFSNYLPPQYFLIPTSFREIIDIIIRFKKMSLIAPFYLEQNYPFIGVNKGADDSNYIISWVMQYLTVAYLRLFSHIESSKNVQGKPVLTEIVEDNESFLHIVELLEHWIAKFQNDKRKKDELQPVINMKSAETTSAIIFLKEFKEEIAAYNLSLKENPQLSAEKVNKFKEAVTKESDNLLTYYPTEPANRDQSFVQNKIVSCVYTDVDHDMFATYSILSFSNLDSIFISQLGKKLSSAYTSTFLMHSPCVRFRVEHRDMLAALDKLSLNSGFVIISLGIYLGNLQAFGIDANAVQVKDKKYRYGAVDIYSINSNWNSLIILKREDLPYVSRKDETRVEISNKDNGYHVNISLEAIINSKDNFKFIQINVINPLFDGQKPTIDQIKSITNYIV